MTSNQLIAWCKSHDWGHAAFLTDNGRVGGLEDNYSQRHDDGTVTAHQDIITMEARYGAIRAWAGY